jgi:hypothetical protein
MELEEQMVECGLLNPDEIRGISDNNDSTDKINTLLDRVSEFSNTSVISTLNMLFGDNVEKSPKPELHAELNFY